MKAQLACYVCRRYLVHGTRAALRRFPLPATIISSSHHTIPISRPVALRQSRRNFLSIFQEPPDVKIPVYPPGWPVILSWKSRLANNLRPPPRAQLVQAFGDLFFQKLQYGIPVHSTQAEECYRLFRYLLEKDSEEGGPNLTIVELEAARDALLLIPKEDETEFHLKFSRELYTEIGRRRALEGDFSREIVPEARLTEQGGRVESTAADDDFKCYIHALTSYGAAAEAAAELNVHWKGLVEANRIYEGAEQLWVTLLKGLADEGLEEELVRQRKVAGDFGVPYGPDVMEIMTIFFAQRNHLEEVMPIFAKDSGYPLATPATYCELVRLGNKYKVKERWLNGVFRTLIDSNPSKAHWDVIFQWAVQTKGEGLERVEHMMNVMVENNGHDTTCRPDIETINGLLRVAMEKDDGYLIERFLALGEKLGLAPNATTHALHMDYRIEANDLPAARSVYEKLRKLEARHGEEMPVLNKYIRALCAGNRPSYGAIQECMSDLEYRVDRVVTLDPETVLALCLAFLKSDKQYQVIDTLAVHVFHYSAKQRELVREAFVGYVLDLRNSTARAWDAYQLLKQFFADAPRATRLRLINGFFNRRRADMAVRVFAHMKQEQINQPDLRPTVDDYVFVLEWLARCRDDEALETMYNLLKLDTNVQLCTKLYNALMLGFSGSTLRRADALNFWNEITRSKEGPSYASLDIVFYVCESLPGSHETAKSIWENLLRMEIEVPIAVFNSYCGALAGSGKVKDVTELIGAMSSSMGTGPTVMT